MQVDQQMTHGNLASLRQKPWVLCGQCCPQSCRWDAVALGAGPGWDEEEVRLVHVHCTRGRRLDAIEEHPWQVVLPRAPLLNVPHKPGRAAIGTIPCRTVKVRLVAELGRQVVHKDASANWLAIASIRRCTARQHRGLGSGDGRGRARAQRTPRASSSPRSTVREQNPTTSRGAEGRVGVSSRHFTHAWACSRRLRSHRLS